MTGKLLLVGNPGAVHVGAHLHRAARGLGIETKFCDSQQAFAGPTWKKRFNWWCRGRRPTRLLPFGADVARICREFQPTWLLTTGLAPLTAAALQTIGKIGARRLNFLTDDPWNPAHRAEWFLAALPHYDHVFSARQSAIPDLQRLGCRSVSFLPFAYAPDVHFPERAVAVEPSDVIFAGGADGDRVPYMAALIRAGLKVALYGGYWERYPETAKFTRGHADLPTLRAAIGASQVALCLVRRANRDGNVMRSFEVPAMGGCLLAEDTAEHREIFGVEGENVMYFQTVAAMVEKAQWLLAHEADRRRLAANVQWLITSGHHTYQDRLQTMLTQGHA